MYLVVSGRMSDGSCDIVGNSVQTSVVVSTPLIYIYINQGCVSVCVCARVCVEPL